jgi:hypothetical protein
MAPLIPPGEILQSGWKQKISKTSLKKNTIVLKNLNQTIMVVVVTTFNNS